MLYQSTKTHLKVTCLARLSLKKWLKKHRKNKYVGTNLPLCLNKMYGLGNQPHLSLLRGENVNTAGFPDFSLGIAALQLPYTGCLTISWTFPYM